MIYFSRALYALTCIAMVAITAAEALAAFNHPYTQKVVTLLMYFGSAVALITVYLNWKSWIQKFGAWRRHPLKTVLFYTLLAGISVWGLFSPWPIVRVLALLVNTLICAKSTFSMIKGFFSAWRNIEKLEIEAKTKLA